jgi:hypothetical protein
VLVVSSEPRIGSVRRDVASEQLFIPSETERLKRLCLRELELVDRRGKGLLSRSDSGPPSASSRVMFVNDFEITETIGSDALNF